MIRLTWAAVIIAIVTGLIFAGQLYEMISGGTQTNKLVGYANTQANASSDQADAAQQFTDTAEDINGGISGAVDQLQAAAENAKASIKATQDALRLEQRAWVFVSGMELKPLVLNDPLVVAYLIKNEGRTPATMRKESRFFLTISFSPIDQLKEPSGNPPFKGGIVFPGIVYGPSLISSASMIGNPPHLLGSNEIAAYNSKPPTLWVYVFGRIAYTDAFGISRETSFCAVSNGTNTFEGCVEGIYPTFAN